MNDPLVRFGVAMESSLLEQFDALVEARGGTRSEALRDLARAAVTRAQVEKGVEAVATLTLIYDHHVRDLTEKLTEVQHELGDAVRSTLHIHLDHDKCLEIVVMHGRSDVLQAQADRILAMKGVLHGALELFAHGGRRSPAHSHSHGSHPHSHAVILPPPAKRAPVKRARNKPGH
ncbi:MAG: nickel-responsive transcriptional regulator NikR [Myxococcales bacterium]|nr:MAG: nickel-responsive transcriptional regulator NikR [Myxococcales bacterium]